MSRILITTDYLKPGDSVDQLLREHGHEPVYAPFRGQRQEGEIQQLLSGVSAAILASEPVTAKNLEGAEDLKVIARSGVGYDTIDLAAARDKGIRVCYAPGTNHHSVAELALGMIIASARNLVSVHNSVKEGNWPRQAGHELRGSTLGIIGFGPSGRALAHLGLALGMNVLVHTSHPNNDISGVEFVELESLLNRSDYVSLHTRANPQSPERIGAHSFRSMKPTAVLINTARGSLVDEDALVDALEAGTIAAAALDVFDSEPLPVDSKLRNFDNVIVTSHLGGQTAEARERAGLAAAQEVIDVLQGKEPSHPVDF